MQSSREIWIYLEIDLVPCYLVSSYMFKDLSETQQKTLNTPNNVSEISYHIVHTTSTRDPQPVSSTILLQSNKSTATAILFIIKYKFHVHQCQAQRLLRPDIHLISRDIHMKFTWSSPDDLTIIWPFPDHYLTIISSFQLKKVIWWVGGSTHYRPFLRV